MFFSPGSLSCVVILIHLPPPPPHLRPIRPCYLAWKAYKIREGRLPAYLIPELNSAEFWECQEERERGRLYCRLTTIYLVGKISCFGITSFSVKKLRENQVSWLYILCCTRILYSIGMHLFLNSYIHIVIFFFSVFTSGYRYAAKMFFKQNAAKKMSSKMLHPLSEIWKNNPRKWINISSISYFVKFYSTLECVNSC